MTMRHPYLHTEDSRIDWLQAHSLRKPLDSPIWFTKPHLDPAAARPGQRHVRINQQGLVKEGCAIIEIPGDIGEHVSGGTKYHSIVLTQLQGASGKPCSFGNLLLSVDDPPKSLAVAKTRSGCRIRCREIGIKFNSLVIQTECFLIPLPSPFVNVCQSA